MKTDFVKFNKPVLIGLTGGPEVGKTEAATIFARKGAIVISADAIGHILLRDDQKIRKKLIKLFGDNVLTAKGEFDRKKIGAIVFNKPDILALYNEIIHPLLLKYLKKELTKQSKNSRRKMVIVDAALIFEWGIADWFDLILTVTAKRNLRLKRLCRKGLSCYQAEKRLALQLPQREKVSLADYVIENNTNRLHLAKKVEKFIKLVDNLLA